jgi:hypothetical protein
VVSVNYQAQEQLRRCLASLKEHCPGEELHLIVVDNSPVSEIELIAQEHPEILAIVPGSNLGFAGGCNLGIAMALERGLEFVLLLNPDTRAEHDFIRVLLDQLALDPTRAMAGPKILHDNARRDVWYGGARMNWWLGGPCQVTDSRHDAGGVAQPVPCLSGCAMLIQAWAIRQVGMMAEGYFLYYEDTDYVQRFIHAGLGVVYCPEACLIHAVSSTIGLHSRAYVYYFSRNRVWFMRRWAKRHHFLVFMLYNTVVKLLGALIIFGVRKRRPELVWAYWQGYWHGIRGYRERR